MKVKKAMRRHKNQEAKEYKRKEYKRRMAKKYKREKRHRLFYEEKSRNILTVNSRQAALEGALSAVYDLGGVSGVMGKRKIPVKDVLRATKMVAAALFANDVDDFMHNYLQDFQFDANAVDLVLRAIQLLITAYDRSAYILKGRTNVECECACTCATLFHQLSAYKEVFAKKIEDENMKNQNKAAWIKKRMLEKEVSEVTPVKNDEERFYMLNTPPTETEDTPTTEDEAIEDDDAIGGGFRFFPQRHTFYDTVTTPPRDFRIPVVNPPSTWERRNNNRPLRVAAILARQREQQQRLAFSPSSATEDFLIDKSYEPATSDFGTDSDLDIEEVRRLRTTHKHVTQTSTHNLTPHIH